MYEAETFAVVVALIVAIAIVGFSLLALVRYWRHRRNFRALPAAATIENIDQETLAKQRALLVSELHSDAKKLPAHEIEVTRHALWMAMLLEAASDGTIDRREMSFVAGLFGQMTGSELSPQPVIDAAEQVTRAPKAALNEISKARDVSIASKEHILAGAFLVSISDQELAGREADCLGDIADALAVNQRDRKAIYDGISKRLTA